MLIPGTLSLANNRLRYALVALLALFSIAAITVGFLTFWHGNAHNARLFWVAMTLLTFGVATEADPGLFKILQSLSELLAYESQDFRSHLVLMAELYGRLNQMVFLLVLFCCSSVFSR